MRNLPIELFIYGIFPYCSIKECLMTIKCIPKLQPFRIELLLRCCCQNRVCSSRLCNFIYHCTEGSLKYAEEVSYYLKLKAVTNIRCCNIISASDNSDSEFLKVSALLEEVIMKGFKEVFYWLVKRFNLTVDLVYPPTSLPFESYVWLSGQSLKSKSEKLERKRQVVEMFRREKL